MKLSDLCPVILAAGLTLRPAPAPALDTPTNRPSNPNLELARQLNDAFVQVADEVSPAVVVITVIEKASASLRYPADDGSGDGDLPPEVRRFWRRYFQQGAPDEPTEGKGSGVIIRKDGYILTNRHVVDGADKIEVRLKDGRTFSAVVRGVDAPSDIAVIKIDAQELPVARLADSSKTRVGEFAIAIGAPFSLDYTVTFGHVSAKDRSNILMDPDGPAMSDQDFIQTDANINPGNSGGPLINIDGEVIGINTLIRGMHTGIGFAIPSNLAREIADRLISDGKFSRVWLGIAIHTLGDLPEDHDLVKGVQQGVFVDSIVPDGPAAKSLQPADVITAIDGKPVMTAQELKSELRAKSAGQRVTLDVFGSRDGPTQPMKIIVRPGLWVDKSEEPVVEAAVPVEAVPSGKLGIAIKTLTPELADEYKVELTDGVIVTRVQEDGPSARAGIKEGDIITSINSHAITSPKQFRDALRTLDLKKGVIINLISDNTPRVETLTESGD
jgi:serine protease Do